MSKKIQIQPTSLVLIVAAIVFIAAKWAYDQGSKTQGS